ncbi:glycerate kinase [Nocardia tenerifensis]|uniref:Glycerate kinase n=1 Tax=Nocardia tenerifensis TaxID=228006 RepID=A0A318JS49_9NOCA|nr:glycerate kinase [Nocardia tenerifensis]PXX52835.1 glycerate kinase [Nocardia tenerifensis]
MSGPDAARSTGARGGWREGHCVVAPDKFKGSLTAPQVAAHIAAGLRRVRPDVPVVTAPVADGGDGTVDAVVESGFVRFQTSVAGPLGTPVAASFAMRGEAAVIELAEASGLRRLPVRPTFQTSLTATSYGTGQLIRAAAARGARSVVLGLGGSACTDGGVGMMQALGVRFLDDRDRELPHGGAALTRLARIDTGDMVRVPVIVASDVDNPLLGPRGAAQVYGPQKGARPGDVDELEWGLARLASIVERDLGADVADRPGAGAAGGVGYAALAFLGATVRPGIELILELMSFAEQVEGARLVITGEGSLDAQTLHGKAPVGVARVAAAAAVPVVAVAGQRSLSGEQLRRADIERAYALTDVEPDPEVCMAQAGPLLERLAGEIAGAWLGASAHA